MACRGSQPTPEGARHFSIWLQRPFESGSPSEPFRILITMGGQYYRKDVVGTGTLRLGPGLSVVTGSLIHRGHVSKTWDGPEENSWVVVLRAHNKGSTWIRAVMTAKPTASRIDEMEMLLPIEITSDTLRFGVARAVRSETVRSGQRYRHGWYLVPIERSEEVTSADIDQGVKVVHRVQGACPEGPVSVRELPFMVLVGRDGAMRSHRFLAGEGGAIGATPAMIQCAEAALKRWSFKPARARSRAVSDWTLVRVPVHRLSDTIR